MRKHKPDKRKGTGRIRKIFGVLALLIGLIFALSNAILTVSEYAVESALLPSAFDGFKVVHLSDLHSNQLGKDNRRLRKAIEKQDPDLVVMTGDMVNTGDPDFSVFLSLATALAQSYPTYFVVGNHEQNLDRKHLESLYAHLGDVGVLCLDNAKTTLEKGGDRMDVYGMWFHLKYYSDQTTDYVVGNPDEYHFGLDKMNIVLGPKNSPNFCLLLTHNPVYFETYRQWGADLTLCGHMHGGMIRLPFFGRHVLPEKTFFPEYDGGLFTRGEGNMIVSRGLGNGKIGFRFMNPPELVVVTLKSASGG